MKRYVDPVTGDELTPSEHISWLLQGIIRRWAFLGIITVATIFVWSTDNSHALVWWNLAASFLALVIEGTVGIAMFSQTRRDAVVIREIRHLAQGQRDAETKRDVMLQHLESLVEQAGSGGSK